MDKLTFFRIGNDAREGLWYDCLGQFTGLIHDKFSFCKNRDLQMPFDSEVVGYLSATTSLSELFNWFPPGDIVLLQSFGYFITIYESDNYKIYKNHYLIQEDDSVFVCTLPISKTMIKNLF